MKLSSFRFILCITAVAAWHCGISARGQELVVNGGFETGTFSPDWVIGGPVDPQDITVGPVFGSFPGHNGSAHYANFGPLGVIGTLTQTINTTPGELYQVSLWVGNDGDGSVDEFLNIYFGGNLLTTLTPSNFPSDPTDFTVYYPVTFTALATSSSSVLQFEGRNDEGYFRLDDVSISVVPEPSTMAFVVLGLGGIVAYQRVKRTRVQGGA